MKLITTKKVIETDESGKPIRTYNLRIINPKIIEKCNLSQSDVVLLHLLHIGGITAKACEKGYGYMFCCSIIRDLKEIGAKIETIKQKGLSQHKQERNYVEYHLLNPRDFEGI